MTRLLNIKLATILFILIASSQSNAQNSIAPNSTLEKTALKTNLFPKKNHLNPKLGYQIQKLIDSPHQIGAITRNRSLITKGKSIVQVYVKVLNLDSKELLLLEKIGIEIEIVNEKLNKIQGWVSTNDISSLAKLDNVISVTTPVYGHSKAGSRITQGDSILRSNLLRSQGITGNGVKVGIISNGSAGLAQAQGSSDLPKNVTLFSSCIPIIPGECAEGTAMAEIIHDIAPDAELAIADSLSSLEFIQRLDQLVDDFNADIIVDDLGFILEPYFEDGDVAQAVNDLPDNIIYVSAAGNDAEQYYQGFYTGRPADFFGGRANIHDFDESTFAAEALPITVLGGSDDDEGCVLLQWNDPFIFGGQNNPTNNDYDLLIFDSENNFDDDTFITSSESAFDTLEGVCFDAPQVTTTYYVVVRQFSGENRELKILTTDSAFFDTSNSNTINGPSPEGSIYGHPAVERVITVGTINANEPGNDNIASFSSQGPVSISFPVAETRAKPDITGIDGVSVTGSADFPSTFFGTSAAAPHIAGIVALLKSFNTEATPEEIKNALFDGAIDLGANGRDNTYGAGRADALRSLDFIPESLVNPNDSDILDFLPAIITSIKNKNTNQIESEDNKRSRETLRRKIDDFF